MSDPVNHPAHYNNHPDGMECIELVEWLPFCEGNAIKYLWRANNKGARSEDLAKARWYIERALGSEDALKLSDRSDQDQDEFESVVDRACLGFDPLRAGAICAVAHRQYGLALLLITQLGADKDEAAVLAAIQSALQREAEA